MRDICFATFVRNESFNLPIWLKYYSQFASPEDMYVFDQNTTDGSTNDLPCNVIQELHPQNKFFDYKFLSSMIQRRQNWLKTQYRIVIFTECDELIITKDNRNLREYLIEYLSNKQTAIEMTFIDIIQDEEEEAIYDPSVCISKQRSYWTPAWNGTIPDVARKSTIANIPYTATIMGFHGPSATPSVRVDNLIVLHFQMLNIETFKQKHAKRQEQINLYNDVTNKTEYNGDMAGFCNALLIDYKHKKYTAPEYFKNHSYI